MRVYIPKSGTPSDSGVRSTDEKKSRDTLYIIATLMLKFVQKQVRDAAGYLLYTNYTSMVNT